MTALDLAARLAGPGPAVAPDGFHLPDRAPDPDGALPLAGPEPGPGGMELSSALPARDSGGRMFLPAARPLAADRLASACGTRSSDHTDGLCRPLVDMPLAPQHQGGTP
ncbi:hypothetical protein OG879_01475 [Streptomyces caniferus]|uniref:hypothetical protein n=1 Tax=Streptomyces caniferus TaxID=285557 RepID=UPI002E2B4330|nr:hypothetical protein [Streptomyces caniferus]